MLEELAGQCPGCERRLRSGALFCPACGQELAADTLAPPPREQRGSRAGFAENWQELKKLAWFFGLLLGASFAGGMWSRFDPSPWSMVFVSVFDAGVVLIAVAMRYPRLAFLLRVHRIPVPMAIRLAVASVTFVALMALYFKVLQGMGVPFSSASGTMAAAGWPLWAMLLFVSVMPALFEELAFRGVIQSSLERIFSARDAWLIQAALFSVLHLAPIIFPSHFLMGLCFGLLRMRTRSVYPGMLLHGVWNALVLLEEVAG